MTWVQTIKRSEQNKLRSLMERYDKREAERAAARQQDLKRAFYERNRAA